MRAHPRRFEVYPYLEQFAMDVARELRKELGGRPDFIIGNYSDGNLVASLLSRRGRCPAPGRAHGSLRRATRVTSGGAEPLGF
jgi:hypothetical protein